MCGWRWQNSTNKTSCNWISEYICIICYATDIPDFCHFFYTHTFSDLKILHSKVPKFGTKVASRQNSGNQIFFVNYTVSVKLHRMCKITQCVCKITHCVWNSTMCTKLPFSDVGESWVWFASKNLTPCRMHWNAFLIAQIIAKCHSFPNMYDMLWAKVDRLAGKTYFVQKNT